MASPLPLTQSSEIDMHAPLTGFLCLLETRLNRINIWTERDNENYSYRCHHVWLSVHKWWWRLSLLFYENSYFFPIANTRFALLHTHVRVACIRDIHFSAWSGDDEKKLRFYSNLLVCSFEFKIIIRIVNLLFCFRFYIHRVLCTQQ